MPAVSTAGPNNRACAVFDGVDDYMDTFLPLSDFITDDASFAIISFMIDAVIASPLQGVLGDASQMWGIYISTGPTVHGVNYDGTSDQISLDADDGIEIGVPLVVTLRHEASSATWTPAELGPTLKVWLKGDDLTGSDGSNITTWTDASGNGFSPTVFPGPISTGPNLEVAELNGMNVASSTANDYVRFPSNPIAGVTAATAMFLVKCNFNTPAAGSNGTVVNLIGHAGNDHYPYTDGQLYLGFASTTRKTVGDPGDVTQWHIGCMRSAASDWKYYFNGAQFFSTATNTVVGTLSGQADIFKNLTGDYFSGMMAELIITNDALSQSDREKCEGYLAHKWGVTSVLDSGHPYKTDAPVTGTGSPGGDLYLSVNGSDEVSVASGATSLMTGDLRLSMTGAGTNAAIKVFECATFNCVPPEGTREALVQNFMDWVGAEPLVGLTETDPFWDNVVLLVGGDGTNGSTTIPDESSYAHGNGTIGDDAQITTSSPLAGTSSILLDGDDSVSWGQTAELACRYSSADLGASTDDTNAKWTVDVTVEFSANLDRIVVGSAWGGSSFAGWFLEAINDGSFRFFTWDGGTGSVDFTTATGLWTTGVTYRIRFDCDGAKVRLYLGGTMVGSANATGTGWCALYDSFGGSLGLRGGFRGPAAGKFDELRITNGICRTGSDSGYTPETLPFPRG